MSARLLVAALAFSMMVSGVAGAQPMMPDPSQMSGIPRPDASVPPGRLTVRVLRGDFAHPMIGQEVILDGPGGERRARVDATDHAVFDELTTSRGAYTVRATAFGTTLTSQAIEMPAESGVKIMLVFKPDEAALLGEHDGVARADKTVPPGAIFVSVRDAEDRPIAGLDLVLARADKAAAQKGQPGSHVEEKTIATDDKGEARFEGKVGAGDAYLIAVKKEGLTAASKPFALDAGAGMRLGLRALAISHDAKALQIGKRSHLILEVKDETVDVIENIDLENQATAPYDPGPAGLVFPLPPGAQGAQLAGDTPPSGLAVEGDKIVWHGAVPPGHMPISFGFVLLQESSSVRLRQVFPADFAQVVLVTDRHDGMVIEATGVEKGIRKDERELNGRRFYVLGGPLLPAGSELDLRLGNLPHRPTTERDTFVTLAGLVLLWCLLGIFRLLGGPSPSTTTEPTRRALETERDRLLDEAAAIGDEEKPAGDGKPQRSTGKRERPSAYEKKVARLEQIYRQLDDAKD